MSTGYFFKARQLAVLSLMMGAACLLLASNAFALSADKVSILLDRSSGDVKVEGVSEGKKLEQLVKKRRVYLDLKIILDGKDKDAVLSSTEEAEGRYEIDCRPGAFGSLTMAEGVEYYIKEKLANQTISASIYPGSRVTHTYNDVACVFDKRFKDKALFHIRGFYAVVSNDLPDGVAFQLRPVTPTPEEVKILE